MGYIPIPDEIKYFVSTGRKDFRGGAAKYMETDPELVERCMLSAGPYNHRENILSFRHVKPFQIPTSALTPSTQGQYSNKIQIKIYLKPTKSVELH
jgi:hypothetical protein